MTFIPKGVIVRKDDSTPEKKTFVPKGVIITPIEETPDRQPTLPSSNITPIPPPPVQKPSVFQDPFASHRLDLTKPLSINEEIEYQQRKNVNRIIDREQQALPAQTPEPFKFRMPDMPEKVLEPGHSAMAQQVTKERDQQRNQEVIVAQKTHILNDIILPEIAKTDPVFAAHIPTTPEEQLTRARAIYRKYLEHIDPIRLEEHDSKLKKDEDQEVGTLGLIVGASAEKILKEQQARTVRYNFDVEALQFTGEQTINNIHKIKQTLSKIPGFNEHQKLVEKNNDEIQKIDGLEAQKKRFYFNSAGEFIPVNQNDQEQYDMIQSNIESLTNKNKNTQNQILQLESFAGIGGEIADWKKNSDEMDRIQETAKTFVAENYPEIYKQQQDEIRNEITLNALEGSWEGEGALSWKNRNIANPVVNTLATVLSGIAYGVKTINPFSSEHIDSEGNVSHEYGDVDLFYDVLSDNLARVKLPEAGSYQYDYDESGKKIEGSQRFHGAFLPQLVNTVTNMAIMVAGSYATAGVLAKSKGIMAAAETGAPSKLAYAIGSVASGTGSTIEQYYKEGIAQGMHENDAQTHSIISGTAQGFLELINPEAVLMSGVTKKSVAEYMKVLSSGATREMALKAGMKTVFRQTTGEMGQEMLQNASNYGTNYLANNITGSNLDTGQNFWEDTKQTVIMTALVSGMMGGFMALRDTKNRIAHEALYFSGLESDKYKMLIQQMEKDGKIKGPQAIALKKLIETSRDAIAKMPASLSHAEKIEYLPLVAEKMRLEEIHRKLDPTFKMNKDGTEKAPEGVAEIDKKIAQTSANQKARKAESPIKPKFTAETAPVVSEETPVTTVVPATQNPVIEPARSVIKIKDVAKSKEETEHQDNLRSRKIEYDYDESQLQELEKEIAKNPIRVDETFPDLHDEHPFVTEQRKADKNFDARIATHESINKSTRRAKDQKATMGQQIATSNLVKAGILDATDELSETETQGEASTKISKGVRRIQFMKVEAEKTGTPESKKKIEQLNKYLYQISQLQQMGDELGQRKATNEALSKVTEGTDDAETSIKKRLAEINNHIARLKSQIERKEENKESTKTYKTRLSNAIKDKQHLENASIYLDQQNNGDVQKPIEKPLVTTLKSSPIQKTADVTPSKKGPAAKGDIIVEKKVDSFEESLASREVKPVSTFEELKVTSDTERAAEGRTGPTVAFRIADKLEQLSKDGKLTKEQLDQFISEWTEKAKLKEYPNLSEALKKRMQKFSVSEKVTEKVPSIEETPKERRNRVIQEFVKKNPEWKHEPQKSTENLAGAKSVSENDMKARQALKAGDALQIKQELPRPGEKLSYATGTPVSVDQAYQDEHPEEKFYDYGLQISKDGNHIGTIKYNNADAKAINKLLSEGKEIQLVVTEDGGAKGKVEYQIVSKESYAKEEEIEPEPFIPNDEEWALGLEAQIPERGKFDKHVEQWEDRWIKSVNKYIDQINKGGVHDFSQAAVKAVVHASLNIVKASFFIHKNVRMAIEAGLKYVRDKRTDWNGLTDQEKTSFENSYRESLIPWLGDLAKGFKELSPESLERLAKEIGEGVTAQDLIDTSDYVEEELRGQSYDKDMTEENLKKVREMYIDIVKADGTDLLERDAHKMLYDFARAGQIDEGDIDGTLRKFRETVSEELGKNLLNPKWDEARKVALLNYFKSIRLVKYIHFTNYQDKGVDKSERKGYMPSISNLKYQDQNILREINRTYATSIQTLTEEDYQKRIKEYKTRRDNLQKQVMAIFNRNIEIKSGESSAKTVGAFMKQYYTKLNIALSLDENDTYRKQLMKELEVLSKLKTQIDSKFKLTEKINEYIGNDTQIMTDLTGIENDKWIDFLNMGKKNLPTVQDLIISTATKWNGTFLSGIGKFVIDPSKTLGEFKEMMTQKGGSKDQLTRLINELSKKSGGSVLQDRFDDVENKKRNSFIQVSQILLDAEKANSTETQSRFASNPFVTQFAQKPMEVHFINGLKNDLENSNSSNKNFTERDVQAIVMNAYLNGTKVVGKNQHLMFIEQFSDKESMAMVAVPSWTVEEAKAELKRIYGEMKRDSPITKEIEKEIAYWQYVAADLAKNGTVSTKDAMALGKEFTLNNIVNKYYVDDYFQGKDNFKGNYTKQVKRAGPMLSNGQQGNTEIIGGIGKTLRHITLADPRLHIELSNATQFHGENNEGVDGPDGISYITPAALAKMEKSFGSLMDIEKYGHNGVIKAIYSKNDDNGKRTLIKTMYVVLSDEFVKNNPGIAPIRKMMDENDADILSFQSAVKATPSEYINKIGWKLDGNKNETMIPEKETGEVNVQELDSNYFLINQDVRHEDIMKQGDQTRQILRYTMRFDSSDKIQELINGAVNSVYASLSREIGLMDNKKKKAFFLKIVPDEPQNYFVRALLKDKNISFDGHPVIQNFLPKIFAAMIKKKVLNLKVNKSLLASLPAVGVELEEIAHDGKRIIPSQAMVPESFKSQGYKKGDFVFITRVPSSQLHSISLVRIGGFTDKTMGNSIVIAPGTMKIAGEDSDADMRHTWGLFRDKKGVPIAYDERNPTYQGMMNEAFRLLVAEYTGDAIPENEKNRSKIIEERFEDLIRPIDTSAVDKHVNKYKTDEKLNPLFASSFIKMFQSNKEGKAIIGIAAKFQAFHAYAKKHNFTLRVPVSFPMFKNGKVVGQHTMFDFNHAKKEQEQIDSTLANDLNQITDNANLQNCDAMGLTIATGGMYLLAESFGVKSQDIMAFMNLPVVREYISEFRKTVSPTYKGERGDIFTTLLNNIISQVKDEEAQNELSKMFFKTSNSRKNIELDATDVSGVTPRAKLRTLMYLQYLNSIGQDIFTVNAGIDLTENAPKSFGELYQAENTMQKIEKGDLKILINSSEFPLSKSPFLNAARKNIELTHTFYADHILSRGKGKSILSYIEQQFAKSYGTFEGAAPMRMGKDKVDAVERAVQGYILQAAMEETKSREELRIEAVKIFKSLPEESILRTFLEVDPTTGNIALKQAYRRADFEIPEIQQTQKAFEKEMTDEQSEAILHHHVAEYGFDKSQKNGAFAILFDKTNQIDIGSRMETVKNEWLENVNNAEQVALELIKNNPDLVPEANFIEYNENGVNKMQLKNKKGMKIEPTANYPKFVKRVVTKRSNVGGKMITSNVIKMYRLLKDSKGEGYYKEESKSNVERKFREKPNYKIIPTEKVLPVEELKVTANHAMKYPMKANQNLTGKETTTLALCESGKRTATTRSFALGKVGDIITFEGRPQKYRITSIEKLTKENTTNPEWINQWSQKEQWTEDHFKTALGGKTVHIGSYQTTFEKVGTGNSKINYQRVENTNSALASSDPELFNYILTRLQKMFPKIEVFQNAEAFQEFIDKHYGGEQFDITALGAAIGQAVNINPNLAVQDTAIHEFAHIYWDMLPANSPIKMELEKLFGSEEAAVKAIGLIGTKNAKVGLRGSMLEKFGLWLKTFWRQVKHKIGIATKEDLVHIMADRIWNKGEVIDAKQSSTPGPIKYMENPSEKQKTIVEGLQGIRDRFDFDPENHIYTLKDDGTIYTSTTQALEMDDLYTFKGSTTNTNKQAAQIGTGLHGIAESLAKGESIEQFISKHNSEAIANGTEQLVFKSLKVLKSFKKQVQEKIDELKEDGSELLPEVMLASSEFRMASQSDLTRVHPNGNISIYDWKSSTKSTTDPEYSTPWLDKITGMESASKQGKHGTQLGIYANIARKEDSLFEKEATRVEKTVILPIFYKIENGKITHIELEEPIDLPFYDYIEEADRIMGNVRDRDIAFEMEELVRQGLRDEESWRKEKQRLAQSDQEKDVYDKKKLRAQLEDAMLNRETKTVDRLKRLEEHIEEQFKQYQQDFRMVQGAIRDQETGMDRFEEMSYKQLTDLYNTFMRYDNVARDQALQEVQKRIALAMGEKQALFLGTLKQGEKLPEHETDLTKWSRVMKPLSSITEKNPILQAVFRRIFGVRRDIEVQKNEMRKKTEKLLLELIKEKEGFNLVQKASDFLSIERNLAKYTENIIKTDKKTGKTKLKNHLSKKETANLTPAEMELLTHMNESMADVSELQDVKVKGKVRNPHSSGFFPLVQKGFWETYHNAGFFTAKMEAIHKGTSNDIFEVKLEFTNPDGKKEMLSYGDIVKKIDDSEKSGKLSEIIALQKTKRYLKMAKNKMAVEMKSKGTGHKYTMENGNIISKYHYAANRGKVKADMYSKDAVRAFMDYMDTMIELKNLQPIMSDIVSVKSYYEQEKANPNLAWFMERLLNGDILKGKYESFLTSNGDALTKAAMTWTYLRVLAFGVKSAYMNLVGGHLQTAYAEGFHVLGLGLYRAQLKPLFTLQWFKKNKAMNIAKKYNIVSVHTGSELETNLPKVFSKLGDALMTLGEKNIQTVAVFGKMTQAEFDSFDREANLIKGSYVDMIGNEKWKERLTILLKEKNDVQGQYSSEMRAMWKHMAPFQGALQFKGWMPAFLEQRFGKYYVDLYGKKHIGSWNVVWQLHNRDIRELIMANPKALFEWNTKSTDAHVLALRKAFRGMLIMGILMAINKMVWGDDKKEKAKGSLLASIISEFGMVYNPNTMMYLTGNAIPLMSTLYKFFDIFVDVAGTYKTSGGKYGSRGDYKLLGKALQAMPWSKAIRQIIPDK